MKNLHWKSIIVAVILSVFAMYVVSPNVSVDKKESVYERVMRTGKIRCGYWHWPPLLSIDSKTKEVSGIFADYMDEVGRLLDLEIEWSEEAGWGTYPADLEAGRFDAMCGGVWPTSTILKKVDFTTPIYYIPIGVYTKKGDTRFDYNLKAANNPNVTISAVDGLVTMRVANADFGDANLLSYPQLTPTSDMLLAVANGKADLTFTDKITVNEFMRNNPDLLQEVKLKKPIRIFGNTSAILKGEQDLKNMLDYANEELINSGIIDRILEKHEDKPGTLIRVNELYKR